MQAWNMTSSGFINCVPYIFCTYNLCLIFIIIVHLVRKKKTVEKLKSPPGMKDRSVWSCEGADTSLWKSVRIGGGLLFGARLWANRTV